MKRAAVVGLIWFVAAAAQAQAPQAQAPQAQAPQAQGPQAQAPQQAQPGASSSPSAAAPASACSLVAQNGDQFVEQPLFGFDPSNASAPLPVPALGVKSGMVLCHRASLIPEMTDYRVLTEMHVPLAIHAGARTLFLGFSDGRLQIGVQDGDLTPEEKTALEDRLGKMQTAMAAKLGAQPQAK